MAKKKSVSKKEDKILTIDISGDATVALKQFGKITKRKPIEVVNDALRTYMWILFEQTFGGAVSASHSNPEKNRNFAHLVKDKKAAKEYFTQYRHLFR